MERFRGFVQKLGQVGGVVVGGDSGSEKSRPTTGSAALTAEILDTHLPLTKSFVAQTFPRPAILAAAAENDRKATEAHRLVRRVDALITAHETAASELKEYVQQLGGLHAELDAAAKTAKTLQNQLLALEELVADASQAELVDLEKAEEARFEAYARERRAQVAAVQRGYAAQLVEFEKERLRMLAIEGGGSGKGKRRVVEVRKGLEKVAIEDKHDGLEDFFGAEEGPAAAAEEASGKKKAKAKVKGKEKAAPNPPLPPRGNPAILADEDIEDEEMLEFYR